LARTVPGPVGGGVPLREIGASERLACQRIEPAPFMTDRSNFALRQVHWLNAAADELPGQCSGDALPELSSVPLRVLERHDPLSEIFPQHGDDDVVEHCLLFG
jgi:hypothetical protein